MAAAQEERFTRIKHDANYPRNAIQFCLKAARLRMQDLDAVVFYEKPFLKFERLIETYLSYAPHGYSSFRRSIPLWLREKLFQKKNLVQKLSLQEGFEFCSDRLFFSEHHLSHAASAFYPSPFEEALVLTMDGVGEWATTSVSFGEGAQLRVQKEIHFPHSLGLLYSAFTQYLGFKVNSGEYKVMGLAPYGQPIYENLILDHLIDLKEDGSFCLNMKHFSYPTGLQMISPSFCDLFGEPSRPREGKDLTQFHMDVAASIQKVCETVVLKLTRALRKEFPTPNLCLAGGVALNCVANGRILKDNTFDRLWIQPAAGDAGGAVGAALAYHYQVERNQRVSGKDQMKGAYLGSDFSQEEINQQLEACGAQFQVLSQDEMLNLTVQSLNEGLAIGWFQGRMEFGPRALGNRSILADPRNENMQTTLNLKIKFRESFRPFAPSVRLEDLSEWFDLEEESPYMLLVADILKEHRLALLPSEKSLFEGLNQLKQKRSQLPAITHVDYSSRIQTVSKETNPLYHRLLTLFKEKTGCPILVNTSFNVRGEPIVCQPKEAFRCFMGTDLDLLVCGKAVLFKRDQDQKRAHDYRFQYAPD